MTTLTGDHIDASCRGLLSVLGGQAPSREVVSGQRPQKTRARPVRSGEQVAQALASLSDDDLAREVPAFGRRFMTLAPLAGLLTLHGAHHKGQVWLRGADVADGAPGGRAVPFFMQR